MVFYFTGKEVVGGRWVEFGEAVAGGKSLLVPANQANQHIHTLGLEMASKFQTLFTTVTLKISLFAFYDFGLVNSYCLNLGHTSIWVNAGFMIKLQLYDINAFASLFAYLPLF